MAKKVTKVACVVLAAGLSKRFGGLKQLATLSPESPPLVQRALDAANNSFVDYVILVLGQSSSEIAAKVKLGRANLVFNKDFRKGLSTSVRCGLSNVPSDANAALFMVADQPFLTSEVLNRIVTTYRAEGSKIVSVSPSPRKEPRNPVLLDRSLFEEIRSLQGDVGAKEVVLKHIEEAEFLEVDDPRIFLDIDTKNTLDDAKRKLGEPKMIDTIEKRPTK